MYRSRYSSGLIAMDTTRLCSRCQAVSFAKIGHPSGYRHYESFMDLMTASKLKSSCDLCSLICWSLRYDYTKLETMHETPVTLFLNPPNNMHRRAHDCIEVVVTGSRSIELFGWANVPSGLWVGPPPEAEHVIRGRLTLYGHNGVFFGNNNRADQRKQRGKYAALSYCWGQKPFLTTTFTTIDERKAAISIESLPETIKDAMTMSQKFDISYEGRGQK